MTRFSNWAITILPFPHQRGRCALHTPPHQRRRENIYTCHAIPHTFTRANEILSFNQNSPEGRSHTLHNQRSSVCGIGAAPGPIVACLLVLLLSIQFLAAAPLSSRHSRVISAVSPSTIHTHEDRRTASPPAATPLSFEKRGRE